jgi:transposase
MSQKEWKRVQVIEEMESCVLTRRDGARLLGLSRRQLRRLMRRYTEEGAVGLRHGNLGRAPPNKTSDEVRRMIVELRNGLYAGFNDHHFTEKLVEKCGLKVSRQTVQRILRAAGVAATRKRRARKYRRRRERRLQPGLLLLWDGSDHDWLEGRGPKLTLMGAIDDATSQLLFGAHFVEEECTVGYLRVLRDLVRHHGVPWEIYMDKHGTLRRNDGYWTMEEELAGRRFPTQVGKALEDLGITATYANSPQAKGRVERLWETLQDRLCSELRLVNACTLEQANRVLRRVRAEHNRRFAKAPGDARPAWRQLPKGVDLEVVCSVRQRLKVRNDNVIRYEGLVIDLPPRGNGTGRAGEIVDLRHLLSGTIRVYSEHGKLIKSLRHTLPTRAPKRRHREEMLLSNRPHGNRKQTLKEILTKYRNAA